MSKNKLVKISAVAYLNAAPFVYGLQHSLCKADVELSLDIPAESAQKLNSGEVDVALMPVASIRQTDEYKIVTDYCIGAVEEVASVCVFAHEPLENLHTIYLDAHSRTSAMLVQLLAHDCWQLKCCFKQIVDYADIYNIMDGVGYLLIGDKTFAARPHFSHIYDLARAWILHTGHPFVFAAWVARSYVSASFIASLNEALTFGVQHINETIKEAQPRYPNVDVAGYLTQHISYPLDDAKRKGLSLFMSRTADICPIIFQA
jgi:chorismate dehydratase